MTSDGRVLLRYALLMTVWFLSAALIVGLAVALGKGASLPSGTAAAASVPLWIVWAVTGYWLAYKKRFACPKCGRQTAVIYKNPETKTFFVKCTVCEHDADSGYHYYTRAVPRKKKEE